MNKALRALGAASLLALACSLPTTAHAVVYDLDIKIPLTPDTSREIKGQIVTASPTPLVGVFDPVVGIIIPTGLVTEVLRVITLVSFYGYPSSPDQLIMYNPPNGGMVTSSGLAFVASGFSSEKIIIELINVHACGVAVCVAESLNGGFPGLPASISLTPHFVSPPVGSVPEPASWAMMLIGFGVMSFSLRQQRNRQQLRLSYSPSTA